jgi:hypothetical protein
VEVEELTLEQLVEQVDLEVEDLIPLQEEQETPQAQVHHKEIMVLKEITRHLEMPEVEEVLMLEELVEVQVLVEQGERDLLIV